MIALNYNRCLFYLQGKFSCSISVKKVWVQLNKNGQKKIPSAPQLILR